MRGTCAPPWLVPHIGRVLRRAAGLVATWLLVGLTASLTASLNAVPCGHAQDAATSSRLAATHAHHATRPNIVVDRARRGTEAPPFFLHLAYLAAHLPQQAKPDDLARYAHLDPPRRMAAAIIHNLDENIGRLMQSIQDNGMDDHTLLFLLSDNGGEPPILGTSNGPHRGQKFDLYEGAIRVPFLARWPGHIPAATQFEPMVHVTDIFPTVLAAAEHKPSGELDGVNLLPYLQGKIAEPPHERLYWLTTDHSQWRRPDHDTNDAQRFAAMRLGEWKLIDLGTDRPQLYRIPSDPAEAHDLAAAEPNRVQQMIGELNAWRESMTPQVVPSDHPIYGRAALQRKGP